MLSELWDRRVGCVLLGPCAPGSLGTGLQEVTCEQVKVNSAQRERKKVKFLFCDPDSTFCCLVAQSCPTLL